MLEICCGSYEDALAADVGGAKRIELNSALFLGGLTPSIGTLISTKENCKCKIISMVRPRGGGFCYERDSVQSMKKDIEFLLKEGSDGIAFGILKENFSIDENTSKEIIDLVHNLGKEIVFHRAFDCCINSYEAIETLIKLGVDRVLTSGKEGNAIEGKKLLKDLQKQYGNEIQILAGSGINNINAKKFMEETGIMQIHSSCKDWKIDITAQSGTVDFGFANDPYKKCYDFVSEEKVRELKKSIGEI